MHKRKQDFLTAQRRLAYRNCIPQLDATSILSMFLFRLRLNVMTCETTAEGLSCKCVFLQLLFAADV